MLDRALALVHTYARDHGRHRLPDRGWWLPEPDHEAVGRAAGAPSR
ncbi:hypothetical protein ACH4PU_34970 [Streptomyces sp. NPDC021100]